MQEQKLATDFQKSSYDVLIPWLNLSSLSQATDRGFRIFENTQKVAAESSVTPHTALQLAHAAISMLTSGVYEDRPRALLSACSYSMKAYSRAPDSPTILHSLAMSYEALGARRQAIRTWRHLYSVEADANWKEETGENLRRISTPTISVTWKDNQHYQHGRTGLDQQLLRVQLLDRVLESLKTETSNFLILKDPKLNEMSEVVSALSGDRFFTDILNESTSSSIERRLSVVKGIAILRSVRRDLAQFNSEAALDLLKNSRDQLSGLNKPLALLADYYTSMALYYNGSRSDSLERATRVFADSYTNQYFGFAGEIGRLLGPLQRELGYPEDSIRTLELTLHCFRITDQKGHIASTLSMLAGAYKELGEYDIEWSYRLEALRLGSEFGDDKRLPVLFGVAALSAAERGEYEAALALHSETFDLE